MTCATCHGEGFIVRLTCDPVAVDACPVCATAAHAAYQTRDTEPRQTAILFQFPERRAA